MAAGTESSASPELRVQRLAYAALDALRLAMPLDLCAYLHVIAGEGPQLYLRAPDLASMTATDAFDLFSALRDTIDAADDDTPAHGQTRVAGFDALAVRTGGAASSGVFVVGRRVGAFTEPESGVVHSLCTTIGDACQAIESVDGGTGGDTAGPATSELTSVSVRVDNGVAHADVVVRVDGAPTSGHASAPRTTEAVALATLHAVGNDSKLGDVTEGLVGGEQIAIALVRDRDDNVRLGAALVAGDPVQAAAAAVLAATR